MLDHSNPVELIGPYSGRPGVSVRQYFERQLRSLDYTEFAVQPIKLRTATRSATYATPGIDSPILMR